VVARACRAALSVGEGYEDVIKKLLDKVEKIEGKKRSS
jgi:hypothetical protein